MYFSEQIDIIKEHLLQSSQTVAVAESVTSGHLQAAFSQAEDAMLFFQGGITAYNLGQKTRHLSVNPIHALQCNCVSPTVAGQMALGAISLFASDWGVSVTGYAAPYPPLNITIPHIYYSFAFRGKIIRTDYTSITGKNPLQTQIAFTNYILSQFAAVLKEM